MELPPQLRQLRDFYYETARALPADRDFVHGRGLIETPAFYTLENLKADLNSPLLMPNQFALYWQGKAVDCSVAVAHKFIKPGVDITFLNKGIIEDYLARGASLVLEGLDILNPAVNAMCAAIDAASECVFSNAVVFFSQRGGEAYRGHFDMQDVLAVQLAGEKRWRIHERQALRHVEQDDLPPERMGRLQAEITMRRGDVLFLKSGTPHQVQTSADYSLHMSFDICDRNVGLDAAFGALMEQYMKESAACYTPTAGVVEKALSHAASDSFKRRLAEIQASHKQAYRQARELFASNRVKALDRWIAAERE